MYENNGLFFGSQITYFSILPRIRAVYDLNTALKNGTECVRTLTNMPGVMLGWISAAPEQRLVIEPSVMRAPNTLEFYGVRQCSRLKCSGFRAVNLPSFWSKGHKIYRKTSMGEHAKYSRCKSD